MERSDGLRFDRLAMARPQLLPALASAVGFALLLGPKAATAQTWSQCNPLNAQCPANTALGMAVHVDFTKGGVNSFVASGSPSYGSDGVSFSVARGGDAHQLASLFYIMFGRVDITVKAAPGPGIVSSLVLESDDLDEVDLEWLGADLDEVQSNYFGKGRTTTYNRGRFHRVGGTQARWTKYTVDWAVNRIVWMADGQVLRVLNQTEAKPGQYPQTPMRIKFGSWAGGDGSFNAPGTVEWARGPTDYSRGPFSMHVQAIMVQDYSTGKEYQYGDRTGDWTSIKAVDGAVNANGAKASSVPASAPAAVGGSRSGLAAVPVGGIGCDDNAATHTQTGWPWVPGARPTGGTIPSGWYMTPEGKIMRKPSDAGSVRAARPPLPVLLLLLAALVLWMPWLSPP